MPQRATCAPQELEGRATSHSRQALPSFSANLTGEPGRSRCARSAGSTILPWGPWSSWSSRHLHGELNPGGVVSHPLCKERQEQVTGHPGDSACLQMLQTGRQHGDRSCLSSEDVRARNVGMDLCGRPCPGLHVASHRDPPRVQI